VPAGILHDVRYDEPVLAVDVGGTKLAAGVVTPQGVLVGHRRRPTPVTPDAEVIWTALAELIGTVLTEYGRPAAAAGIGCGGPMSWPAGEVSPINMPAWRGFPVRTRVADLLTGGTGHREMGPVRLHNDAICVAVGEHWRGAGRGVPDVLGMVVGTGVGGGLVLGNRLIDGASGNAGHIGHVLAESDGRVCGCGARGCLEGIARGPAIVQQAQEDGWTGEPTGVALASAATAGNPLALAAYARAGRALGVAIASAVNLTDVSLVTIGGGVIQTGPSLLDPLAQAYADRARLPFSRRPRVLPAQLGQAAGLVGAAALVLRGDRYWSGD
jgi:glucokinase